MHQEYERFRWHVGFVFAGPLAALEAKQKAGWLGTWTGKQGREIYKTLEWANSEKVARHQFKFKQFKQRKQGATESFDRFVKDLKLLLMDCEYADSDDMLIDAIIDYWIKVKTRH